MEEDEWSQIKIRMPKEVVDAIDRLVAETNGSRQQFILGSVENGLESLAFLRKFGLTPRRLKRAVEILEGMGFSPQEESSSSSGGELENC